MGGKRSENGDPPRFQVVIPADHFHLSLMHKFSHNRLGFLQLFHGPFHIRSDGIFDKIPREIFCIRHCGLQGFHRSPNFSRNLSTLNRCLNRTAFLMAENEHQRNA